MNIYLVGWKENKNVVVSGSTVEVVGDSDVVEIVVVVVNSVVVVVRSRIVVGDSVIISVVVEDVVVVVDEVVVSAIAIVTLSMVVGNSVGSIVVVVDVVVASVVVAVVSVEVFPGLTLRFVRGLNRSRPSCTFFLRKFVRKLWLNKKRIFKYNKLLH